MTSPNFSKKPSSFRTRFAYRFLRALKELNSQRSTSSSKQEIYGRIQQVKIAADASMASAVGRRRAWSRAMLWKIRNRSRLSTLRKRNITHAMRRRLKGGNPNKGSDFGEAYKLRKLVPGGETMDICSLLGETAHYIKCLTTQVQVMRNIVDFYST